MKKLRIGLDFDGVVAYNPTRILRAPFTIFKKKFLGVNSIKFFVPQHTWQRAIWIAFHKSSFLPSKGVDRLVRLSKNNEVELHLVTARFNFLSRDLYAWIDRYGITEVFKTININIANEQPHLFKERMIKKYKFDYFIEDNLDIVNYLDKRKLVKLYWIQNIVDKAIYPNKKGFNTLKHALEDIFGQEK